VSILLNRSLVSWRIILQMEKGCTTVALGLVTPEDFRHLVPAAVLLALQAPEVHRR
jgi:hypothetical protein